MFKTATAFNQDLSGWCVSGFSAEPYEFDRFTLWIYNTPSYAPNWGAACS
jgi:hypothetical protein